jgi:hypothetical protein
VLVCGLIVKIIRAKKQQHNRYKQNKIVAAFVGTNLLITRGGRAAAAADVACIFQVIQRRRHH